MSICPECRAPVDDAAAACPSCGAPPPRGETPPTLAAHADATRPWAGTPRGVAADRAKADRDGAAFKPGTLLGGRYRIVGLLGVGGMGAVYRAQDQKLGQEIALKFIAEDFARDERALSLLVNEVRTARRVSHPNVCRVHDIGEVDGRTFISMEYVGGEDLASLLRRIGRLSGEKAAQIARQLCAGLQAAHEQGVLHRDLKPANVMLDADGNVRITDFGIAAVVESLASEETASGTPAYMAPELFTGGKASPQSDLYSLGLVLYEIYTGAPLFRARSMTELLKHHRAPIRPPAEIVPEIDPRVERVILRCLEHDPDRRPASALAALAALPGGDPLAEALASGRTPSPELIAASGGSGALRPTGAAAHLAALAAGIALLLALEPWVKLFARVPLPRSAEVLAYDARQQLDALGYPTDGVSRAEGFEIDERYIDEIRSTCPTAASWDKHLLPARPSVLGFWYRQVPAPRRLVAHNVKGRVSWSDPPPVDPGNVQLRLDPSGRLHELLAVPARQGADEERAPGTAAAAPDWGALFEAAGLDRARFTPVPPSRIPHAFADARAAWRGAYPEPPHVPIRIEAAALDGRPIAFHIAEDRWPEGAAVEHVPEPPPATSWRFLARVGLVLAAVAMAHDSIRKRRGDARGALRLGVAMFALVALFTMLTGDHERDLGRVGALLVMGMTHGLVVATEFALYYFALEPHVRRTWPETMISWSRLVTGQTRDPLVGHHLLVGQALGIAAVLIAYLRLLVPRLAGHPEGAPILYHDAGLEALAGTGAAAGALLEIAVDFARSGMAFFMALVVLRLVLRRRGLAALAAVLVWATVWTTDATWTAGFPWIPLSWLANVALATLIAAFAIRYGLLPLIVGFVFFGAFTSFPLELGPEAWYGGASVLLLLVTAVSAAWGARCATRVA